MMNEQILSQLKTAIAECSSKPLGGSEKENVELLMDRIQFFRDNGVPEKKLYDLEAMIPLNFPAYFCENFDRLFLFLQYDPGSVTSAVVKLHGQHYLAGARRIGSALANWYDRYPGNLGSGQYCFQNEFEKSIWRIEQFGTKEAEQLTETHGNITAFLVAYASVLQNLRIPAENGQPSRFLTEEARPYLRSAALISPCNPDVWYAKANASTGDPNETLFRLHIRRGLAVAYRAAGTPGSLSSLYGLAALHFLKRGEKATAQALYTAAVSFGGTDTSVRLAMHEYGLSDQPALDWQAVLKSMSIQIGFSNSVIRCAHMLNHSDRCADMQEEIEYILRCETDIPQPVNPTLDSKSSRKLESLPLQEHEPEPVDPVVRSQPPDTQSAEMDANEADTGSVDNPGSKRRDGFAAFTHAFFPKKAIIVAVVLIILTALISLLVVSGIKNAAAEKLGEHADETGDSAATLAEASAPFEFPCVVIQF